MKKQCDLLATANRPRATFLYEKDKEEGGERGTGIVRLAGERYLLPVVPRTGGRKQGIVKAELQILR